MDEHGNSGPQKHFLQVVLQILNGKPLVIDFMLGDSFERDDGSFNEGYVNPQKKLVHFAQCPHWTIITLNFPYWNQ